MRLIDESAIKNIAIGASFFGRAAAAIPITACCKPSPPCANTDR